MFDRFRLDLFRTPQRLIRPIAIALFLPALLLAPGLASAAPCDVPEGPPGTVTLPPAGCGYLSPDDVHMILNDLPPGTTIEIGIEHKAFFCGGQGVTPCSIPLSAGTCEGPGGDLGGTVDCFNSEAELTITGTGALAGFNRIITVPLTTEVHAGPRTPGEPVQGFETEMVQLSGAIPPGDPDFDILQITAGSFHGLPSPGHTTLTDNGGGNWSVDSFFDIEYTIDFQGQPGSAIEGFSGTTQGTITMAVGDPPILTPALSKPGWLLLGALVMGGSVFVLRRRRASA